MPRFGTPQLARIPVLGVLSAPATTGYRDIADESAAPQPEGEAGLGDDVLEVQAARSS
jgi:hypothetical protein